MHWQCQRATRSRSGPALRRADALGYPSPVAQCTKSTSLGQPVAGVHRSKDAPSAGRGSEV